MISCLFLFNENYKFIVKMWNSLEYLHVCVYTFYNYGKLKAS